MDGDPEAAGSSSRLEGKLMSKLPQKGTREEEILYSFQIVFASFFFFCPAPNISGFNIFLPSGVLLLDAFTKYSFQE